MRVLLLFFLLLLFQADYNLPAQPDLDLPILPEHYDPASPAPGPIPHPPAPDEADDPRDEPPPLFFGEEIVTETPSLIYVLDFSGSMDFGGRMAAAKREFTRSVSGLPAAFEFNVVVYDCVIGQWSASRRPATEADKADAIRWVDALHPAGGGTATGPAVALALADKTNMAVVLLTDGDPNCGANFAEGHRAMIRAANSQGATISVFGIDAWGEYLTFCKDVAADSRGSYHDLMIPRPIDTK